MSQPTRKLHLLFGIAGLLALGCVPPGDGLGPESDDVYFPVGLLVDDSARHLIVVNSDFDLRYNQGTIQSLSLKRVREIVPIPCSADGDCEDDQICDVSPSEENRGRPSFLCVDEEDRLPCKGIGEKSDDLLSVSPGRCSPVVLSKSPADGKPLLVDVVETSAFATQGLLLSRPCIGDDGEVRPCDADDSNRNRVQQKGRKTHPHRLIVPLRGDTSIRVIEFTEDGEFRCGRELERVGGSYRDAEKDDASPKLLRCSSDEYRVELGTTFAVDDDGKLITTEEPPDPAEDEDEKKERERKDDPADEFRLQPEPFDLTSTDDDQLVVISHQTNGRATTLFNDWQNIPHIVHVLDEGLSENPIGVAALPGAANDDPSFLLTYRSEPRIDLLRFIDDGLVDAFGQLAVGKPIESATAKIYRPSLAPLASTNITTNSSGAHSRGVLVDDSQRKLAIEACAGELDCLLVAEQTAFDVYVANRSPNSLLLGRTGGTDAEAQASLLPSFYDNIPLTSGPSRIVKGYITGNDGEKHLRIFVICFDSALIYVFNPQGRRVESVIRTGRGPYSLAFDPESSLAFVGHFLDSYVGVISLDARHPRTFGSTLLTLGTPTPPRASK